MFLGTFSSFVLSPSHRGGDKPQLFTDLCFTFVHRPQWHLSFLFTRLHDPNSIRFIAQCLSSRVLVIALFENAVFSYPISHFRSLKAVWHNYKSQVTTLKLKLCRIFRGSRSWYTHRLCPSPVLWPWATSLNSPCLSVHICVTHKVVFSASYNVLTSCRALQI